MENKEVRERVADVLDKSLPWLRKDLVKLADEILNILPPPPKMMSESEIAKNLLDTCDKELNGSIGFMLTEKDARIFAKALANKIPAEPVKAEIMLNIVKEQEMPVLPPKEPEFNPQSMDAVVWAKEFNKTLVKKGIQPFDPGFLIGWFANAIMAGFDEANRRKLPKERIEELKILHSAEPLDSLRTEFAIVGKLNELIKIINKE